MDWISYYVWCMLRKLPVPALPILQPALQALVSSSKATPADEIFDYVDTFLDEAHIKECFPSVVIDDSAKATGPSSHYRLVISRDNQTPDGSNDKVVAFPYHRPSQGPYLRDQRPSNNIRFTKVQIEAVRSAMNEVSYGCITAWKGHRYSGSDKNIYKSDFSRLNTLCGQLVI
jgi:hypothetical protein